METFLLSTDNDTESEKKLTNKTDHLKIATETYWSSEYHKCHALKETDHIFCVLYTSTVPTHTMRLITQKTLKTILQDKQICW